jgi:hypothetical protein
MKISIFLSILFCAAIQNLAYSKIHFVNILATGTASGENWANAFTELQQGLLSSVKGDTVWVAKGTYFAAFDTKRTRSFEIPKGVVVLGGFAGTETAFFQRNFEINKSILSGDIGVKGDRMDNVYHVIFIENADSTNVIDGLVIADGFASHPTISNPDTICGGAMLLKGVSNGQKINPRFRNCTFFNNQAKNYGGVFYSGSQYQEVVRPTFENCHFVNNFAFTGGAIYLGWGDKTFDYSLKNCDFIENKSKMEGSAVYFYTTSGNIFLENLTFERDSNAVFAGNGVLNVDKISNETKKVVVKNCVFKQCASKFGGGLVLIVPFQHNQTISITIDSCLFEQNFSNADNYEGSSISCQFGFGNADLLIQNCQFLSNKSGSMSGCLGISGYSNPQPIRAILKNNVFSINKSSFKRASVGNFLFTKNMDLTFQNCLFYKNDGGPVFNLADTSHTVNSFQNCTFFENGLWPIHRFGDSVSIKNKTISLVNCILWEHAPLESMFVSDGWTSKTIEGCSIKNSIVSVPNCVYQGVDIAGAGVQYQVYPKFRDTLNGDFRIPYCSPAVNSGDKNLVNPVLNQDLFGHQRVFGNQIDLGAIESRDSIISFNSTISDAILPNLSSGSIQITNVAGGWQPYFFEWNTGQTTSNLSNLLAGNYQISIKDSIGCTVSDTFLIKNIVSAFEETGNRPFFIFPNPIQATNSLIATDLNAKNLKFEILNNCGQLEKTVQFENPPFVFDNLNLKTGIHFYKILDKNGLLLFAGKIAVP